MDLQTDRKPALANKVDLGQAVKLRYDKGLTLQEIADLQGVRKQSVHRALQQFEEMLPNPEELRAYANNKAAVLEGIEYNFVVDLADKDKRKDASLNNTAYAFQQVNKALHLERGQATDNVGIQGTINDLSKRKEELLSKLATYAPDTSDSSE